ncbi:N/A [soil metagenome]
MVARIGSMARGNGAASLPPAMAALTPLPLPDMLAIAARNMAPAYLRRRIARAGAPYTVDGATTFAYVGDAESVDVVHFMARFPEFPPMERVEDSDLWHVTVALPPGSRVEYKLEVVGIDRTDRILDPLNRRTASDPFGSNSVAHAPGYVEPSWVNPNGGAPGTLEAFEIEKSAFGDRRLVSVYLPPCFPDDGPYPLVVLHDGSDMVEYASLATVLDNLFGAGAVRPAVVALLDPVHRSEEYTASETHADFVVEDVLPRLATGFHTTDDPALRVIGGSSLGAVASLATAWYHPGIFASTILLSGSFVTATGGPMRRGPLFEPVIAFMKAFTENPGQPSDQVWMAVGTFEGLVADNRAFRIVLEATGMAVQYEEVADGHHWQSWRNLLGGALLDLLPAGLP